MYLVSEAFLQAVQENTRSYYWIGKITTKNGMIYEFGPEQIVKGSGYISSQCRGSSGIELGMYEVSEVNRTVKCLELKAYDYMLQFEKNFNGLKCYNCSIIDLYDRSVVASITDRRITSNLAIRTLQKALESQPTLKGELILHSDQGTQYTSKAFTAITDPALLTKRELQHKRR